MPPFVGAAVNATGVLVQTAPLGLALTLTLGTSVEFTVIVTESLTTVAGVVHTAFEVRIQYTISPLANALLE
jgi:hypothetical protein